MELARDLLELALPLAGLGFPLWVVLWILVSEYVLIRGNTRIKIVRAIATAAVLPLVSFLPLLVATRGVLQLCTYLSSPPISFVGIYSKIFYPDTSTYLVLGALFLLWILVKTLTDALVLARILHRPAQERRSWTLLIANASIFGMALVSFLVEVAALPKPVLM